MHSLIKYLILYICKILLLFVLVSCVNLKTVDFTEPVDTTSKKINIQEKKTYYLPELGVYASNEFDAARLNDLKKENDSTALVIINPENKPINNSAYYAFKTWSDNPKTFYFKFQYPLNYKHRYVPKLKIDNSWHIIDSLDIYKNDSIVTIRLNLNRKPIVVAAQQVQSSNDVKNWYLEIAKSKNDLVKINIVGKSKLGRDIPVLDINRAKKKGKKILVLLTRQHPPEVTGYFAFQGFLETILNNSKLSNQFLQEYRVLAFPIMNPDGVDLGHWRHNSGGVDLNRDWSVYNQPEIRNVVKYIDKTLSKNDSKLVLGLDFHSTWYDVFYTNEQRENTAEPDFIKDWFASLEKNIKGYKVNEASANSKKPTSKGWFLNGQQAVGITFEIGDKTSNKDIDLISSVSAKQMMKVLLSK
jgi:cytosolic carboxypeptidase protein 6